MILGIDCSRMGSEKPTGVELYTDRVLAGVFQKVEQLGYDEVRCYVSTVRQLELLLDVKEQHPVVQPVLIERHSLWTLMGLSWELFRRPVQRLFVPSHMLPFWAPRGSVVTIHGIESLLFPQAYTWQQRLLQRLALWQAKRNHAQIIAVSQTVKDQLVHRSFDAKNIAVIWNGFDAVDSERDHERRIKGDYILSVGRLEERKNQLRLIQAFEQLASEYPKLKLVLAGPDGYGAEQIRKQAQSSSVKDRMVFVGYVEHDEVQSLMKNALFLAYPSLSEGFGIPLLEAFSSSCPVLTSRGSAPEEVAGDAAIYCDPFSVDSIREGMKKLLEEKSLRAELIEKGRTRLERFSWEKTVEGVRQFL